MVLETQIKKDVSEIKEKVDLCESKLGSGEAAGKDDIILTHWGSAMLQLSVSDLDSLDRVVAISSWAALAFTTPARRDQAKSFLGKHLIIL